MKNSVLLISLAVMLVLSMGLIGCGAQQVPETTQYNLTIYSTDGGDSTTCVPSIGCTCGEGTEDGGGLGVPEECVCAEGTEVSIEATPNAGYRFVGWSGDVETIADAKAATTTITMSGNYSITANFEAISPVQYSLTISTAEGGSVTNPGSGIHTYDAGTVVNLTAKADENYGFVKWTGDVGSIADVNASETTIIVNSDYLITATFAIAIYDWYDLDVIRYNLEGDYVLMNDLDATTAGYAQLAGPTASGGRGWDPIGDGYWDPSSGAYGGELFLGTFDGHGCAVNDMYINRPNEYESEIGLFGWVGSGGVVENLGVVDADVSGFHDVGALVGRTYMSTIDNCYSIGMVTGDMNVGGLVGITVADTVRNSYFAGEVTGVTAVGGLIGQVHGVLSNSYYDWDEVLINGKNVITAGALFGEDFEQWLADGKFLDVNERLSQQDGYCLINSVSDFKQLLAFGQDSSLKFRLTMDLDLGNEPDFYIPYLGGEFDGDGHRISNLTFDFGFVYQVGLIGALFGKITQVGVDAVDVSGGHFVGGLVGGNAGTISECYSSGRVVADGLSGGLVGSSWGTVTNSYSTCTVGQGVGAGLVGASSWGTVSDSYSIGRVTCDPGGGLVFLVDGGVVRDCFWDTQTSGRAASAGGTGKTTAQMKNMATFSGAGWNITAVAPGERNTAYIWNIVDGHTYPFLSWQPVS